MHGGSRAPADSTLCALTIVMKFSLFRFIRKIFGGFDRSHRERVTAITALEAEELENIFALLLLGSFVGMPAPPTFLAVELLPFMERELKILNKRAKDCEDMFAEMCGSIGID